MMNDFQMRTLANARMDRLRTEADRQRLADSQPRRSRRADATPPRRSTRLGLVALFARVGA